MRISENVYLRMHNRTESPDRSRNPDVLVIIPTWVHFVRYRCHRHEEPMREELVALPPEKLRFAYRLLHGFLRKQGQTVNRKRVWGGYGGTGSCVKRRRCKGLSRTREPRLPATHANPGGRLTLRLTRWRALDGFEFWVETFTRECLALETRHKPRSSRDSEVLERIISRRGCPVDNGPIDKPSFSRLTHRSTERARAHSGRPAHAEWPR